MSTTEVNITSPQPKTINNNNLLSLLIQGKFADFTPHYVIEKL